MDNREAVNWLINISADIGKVEHSDLWHYERALTEIKDMLESIQPVETDTNVGDKISRQAAIDAVDAIGHIATMPDGDKCIRRSAVKYTLPMLSTSQPVETDTNVGDKISKFIDGLEEIFADLRERHVDDSVCGLCEYDGAYMGQSGDWCNECPGFDRDDCFKLSDKTRKEWTDEIIKALPPAQPEPKEGHWIPRESPDGGEQYECSECGVLWEFNDGTPKDNEAYYCPKCGTKMKGADT